jgi:hypothetical protein
MLAAWTLALILESFYPFMPPYSDGMAASVDLLSNGMIFR